MVLPVAYVASLVAGWLLSAFRREPTVVKVSSLLWLTVGFFAVELARPLGEGQARHWGALLFFGAAAVMLSSIRRWWLLGAFDDAGARATLEQCMAQLRIAFERREHGYSLRLKDGESRVVLKSLGGSYGALCLPGDRRSRKLALLRSLLLKRFARLVPRPRIRFG